MSASVVIPCYNVEKYIYECLDSVKLQGECVDEIFCVDNNSSDNTINVIVKWGENNPEQNITLLKETKPGACAARNKPLELIQSEWIQFLDADDLLLEDKISLQIQGSNGSDLIYDSFVKRGPENSEIVIIPNIDVALGIMESNLGNTCSNLWRTVAIKEIGGWNEKQTSSQEYDLLSRLYQEGCSFQMQDNCKTVIRERVSGQISQGNQKLIWENYTNLRVSFFENVIQPHKDIALIKKSLTIIFGATQILYQYNPNLAVEIHNTILKPNHYLPTVTTITSRFYLLTYSILGYRFAERLRTILRKLKST
jgi:glycosyltransferase involved in cell wall biosynthesis